MSKKQDYIIFEEIDADTYLFNGTSPEDVISQLVDGNDDPDGTFRVVAVKDLPRYECVKSKVSIKRIK